MPHHFATSCLLSLALIGGAAHAADAARVIHPDALPAVTVSEGVQLKELTGRVAPPGARSTQGSVALFQLASGKASAWSHNKLGEESFFILEGRGEVWVDGVAHAVGPGDYILVQPQSVRSIRASKGEPLKFYAITTPAWSQDDDVLVPAPAGAPK
jgi:mannose-6-phosphate isomerase-like protein (cupin superfamily)